MTTLWLRRVGNSLFPDGDESIAELSKIAFDKSLRCEVKQPRNSQHHKLFWSVCARVASGIGAESDAVCDVLKIATGHYTLIRSKSYGEIKLPKSISFAKMDQTQFRTFFDKCMETIFTEWGIDRNAFSDLLDMHGEYGTTKSPDTEASKAA